MNNLNGSASRTSQEDKNKPGMAGPGSVQHLTKYLMHAPRHRGLMTAEVKPTRWQSLWKHFKKHCFADASAMHGTCYVTDTTVRDSQAVANVVTSSNWIDGVGNFSLLAFAMGVTSPLGWISAGLMTGILLKFDQEVFTVVARGRRQGRFISYGFAVLALIPLSVLKTLGTGIGVEVMQNQAGLKIRHSTALVRATLEEERAQIAKIEQADPTYQAVKSECQRGQSELGRLNHTDPRYQSLYVTLYGVWNERNRDWRQAAAVTTAPMCIQKKLIEADLRMRSAAARKRLEGIERKRVEMGNDQKFLKEFYPERYKLSYLPNGDFASTTELVAVGIENVTDKLVHGQWNQLGLSLYILLVSALTSASACFLVLMHSHRPHVALSWDEDLRVVRDQWLSEKVAEALEHDRQDARRENEY